MHKSKLVVLILLAWPLLSVYSSAKERRGAEVMITKQDMTQVSGELIAVKKDSLLLLVEGPVAATDFSLNLAEINEVVIIKKSKAGIGICFGLLIGGAIGSIIGLASGDDPPGFMSFTALQKAALVGAVLGGTGMIAGGIVGGLAGTDESISFTKKSKAELQSIQTKLVGFARLNDKIY